MQALSVSDTLSKRPEARQSPWRRKVAGLRLVACILALIIYLPICLLGWLAKLIGFILLWPAGKVVLFSFLEVVRLWYVHSFGRLHLKLGEFMKRKTGRRPHSRPIRIDIRSKGGRLVSIHTLAQLTDNYGYLIVNREPLQDHDGSTFFAAVVVDCADAAACRSIIESITNVHYGSKIRLQAILTTHHHWDHQAGNLDLQKAEPTIQSIYGGHKDRVLGCNHRLRGGDRIEVANGLVFDAVEAPCHTRGSLIYRLHGEGRRDALFTGDTLFVGGCGATFEGTPQEMKRNFSQMYLHNSPESLLFPGHEYSERILTDLFLNSATQLAGQNPQRFFGYCTSLCRVKHLRSLPFPAPTVPVKLKEEVMYNPNFQEVLTAVWTLRTAVFRKQVKRQDEAWGGNSQDLTGTVSPRRMIAEDEEAKSIKPRVAIDEHGTVVVVEPPWITNGDIESPWAVTWKSDIDKILMRINKIPTDSLRPVLYSQLTKLRTVALSVDLEAMPPDIPSSGKAIRSALKPLIDPFKPNTVTLEVLENCLLYNYGPVTPVSYADFDNLIEKLREGTCKADDLTRDCSASLYDEREFPFDSLVAFVIASLELRATAGVEYAKTALAYAHQESEALRGQAPVPAPPDPIGAKHNLDMHIHDFTACRVCQGEAVEGVPSRPTLIHHSSVRATSSIRALQPMLSTVVTTSHTKPPPVPSGRFGVVIPTSPAPICEDEFSPPDTKVAANRGFYRTNTTPAFKRKPDEMVQAAQFGKHPIDKMESLLVGASNVGDSFRLPMRRYAESDDGTAAADMRSFQ